MSETPDHLHYDVFPNIDIPEAKRDLNPSNVKVGLKVRWVAFE